MRSMEPPRGFLALLWSFICFLPYFIGLLILGIIKGIVLCPLVCFIVSAGNYAVMLGLWPVHVFYTYYCILSTKQFGPVLKLLLCPLVLVLLIFWPVVAVIGTTLGGAAYGFFSPMLATFQAVGEGKTNQFFHCIYDGTQDTVKRSFTVVRDFMDVCYYSYFSIMDDLRVQGPSDGKYYEIRLLYVPGALIAGGLGASVDVIVITVIASCKFLYMLFKGWHRLSHDCVGREGPFLETICVPFAGLAILLWPMVVVGALLGSMVASIFLGFYAAVVVYQESSFWLGLCYIAASLSIYDEYTNDFLDMPEGSCFPRPQYRKNAASVTSSRAASFSRLQSFKNPPPRASSFSGPMVELKSLELVDSLFKECQRHGEIMVSEGIITLKDIENAKSSKDSGKIISTGLPAYCILQGLLRSAKANSAGILLNDNVTEITSTNRPKDAVFDWFFNPLLIIKEQIKAENLSEAEELYLGKLVLLSGDPERLKKSDIGAPPESELRRAELDALARRLQGITRSISRYPTFRRRFDTSMKIVLEELAKRDGESSISSGLQTVPRSQSMFARMFSEKSFRTGTGNHGSDQEPRSAVERDVDII